MRGSRALLAMNQPGLDAVHQDVLAQEWPEIVKVSGIDERQIRHTTDIYVRSRATMICYGMGLTQHQRGSRLLQQVANLLVLQGKFGKPGAGISPIRGHSNVQEDRTVGIGEQPSQAYLGRVRDVFGFESLREKGHQTVEAVEAMLKGEAKVFIGSGGNFVRAIPDIDGSYDTMRHLALTVH